MIIELLTWIGLSIAGVGTGLFLMNLLVYRPLRAAATSGGLEPVSVLIPARNEERNIQATLDSVLRNEGLDLEVIVLDDGSTDRTAEIVRKVAALDPRVRLERSPALPAGWCGKQHACHVLGGMARYPILVFMDADVRLFPNSLSRISAHMGQTGLDLLSGVPRQELKTFSEKLLLPLIHFVLLAYLPMHLARRSKSPAFAAGCGQLMVARSTSYRRAGGHASIRASLHDGVKLPRAFRRAGLMTGLFDATDVATCRMYQTDGEVWRGLAKNATEGLAARGTIGPMTFLLSAGQILPYVALTGAVASGSSVTGLATLSVGITLIPRLIAWRIYGQPLTSALLHPIGIAALLFIQWRAFFGALSGTPSEWKGRTYNSGTATAKDQKRRQAIPDVVREGRRQIGRALLLIFTTCLCYSNLSAGETLPACELSDQYGKGRSLKYQEGKLLVLVIADRKGSEDISNWIQPLKERFGSKLEIQGIADVAGVPRPLRGMVRKGLKEKFSHPVLMDWDGEITSRVTLEKGVSNVILVSGQGEIAASWHGRPDQEKLKKAFAAIEERLLGMRLEK